jgi:putative FmdB family regulatory protein
MPFYEYRCEACGHELEALQKMRDAPLADCPECGAASLTKLISAAGFQLKGGGWYETDFKNKNAAKKADSDTSKGDSDTSGSAATHAACGSGACPTCS